MLVSNFNNWKKLDPRTIHVWARVLNLVPSASLWLMNMLPYSGPEVNICTHSRSLASWACCLLWPKGKRAYGRKHACTRARREAEGGREEGMRHSSCRKLNYALVLWLARMRTQREKERERAKPSSFSESNHTLVSRHRLEVL